MIEDNRKVMSYKGNNNMGKNGSKIEIQEGSNLANPLVIGKYTRSTDVLFLKSFFHCKEHLGVVRVPDMRRSSFI